MRNKLILLAGILLLLGLLFSPGAARAGGWATLTLTELPKEVVAERPFTIEFTMRQHGHAPVTGFDATVLAVHSASGEQLSFATEANPDEENYTATLVLPQAGEWQWEIETWGRVYPMPPLMVNEAVAAANGEGVRGTAVGAAPVAWQLILGWITAVGAVLSLFFWTRQRSKLRLAAALLLGVVSVAGFVLHAQMPQSVLAESETATLPAIAPEALGEALFVAKGCIQCHTNDKVTMAPNVFPVGPNLTFVKRPPEYLQAWLADPSSLKPDTQMPNLHLSDADITTLVEFLVSE
ncbi:MAG: hypothetical protein IPM53_26630 [Anaerolineaceae bacterium]|nr:hypothetical protein [Anaerolineaceae bacterium]